MANVEEMEKEIFFMRPFDRGVAAGFVVLLALLTGVSFYGRQTVEDLRGEIAQLQGAVSDQDRKVAGLEASVFTIQFDVDGLRGEMTGPMGALESDLQSLQSDLRAIKGGLPAWSEFFDRNMTELDDDLAVVEGCLRSVTALIEGFGFFLDFRCSQLPFG